MTPMRSVDFRSIVEPILNEPFDGIYDLRDDEYAQIFQTRTGIARAYHEEPVMHGMGPAPELPEGNPVSFDSGGILFIKRYYYAVYGLAFGLTKVLVEDGDHVQLGRTFSEHLAQSMIETKETLGANILNNAFTTGYNGGDGVALSVNNHPIVNGTFSNLLTTAAAMSQTSVEQMLIQMRNAVDNNQRRIRIEPDKIVTGPSNVFQAEVILKSVLRTGGANNDINPVKSMGLLKGGQANVSRVTSTTAWWIKAGNVQEGLKLMMRCGIEKGMEGDFETNSMRYRSDERYDMGWTDPRDIWGTPGI